MCSLENTLIFLGMLGILCLGAVRNYIMLAQLKRSEGVGAQVRAVRCKSPEANPFGHLGNCSFSVERKF